MPDLSGGFHAGCAVGIFLNPTNPCLTLPAIALSLLEVLPHQTYIFS